MYRVREDGLQTAHAFATHSDAWHTDTATSQWECQARCVLADVLCISVITQIYSWNWRNRRAHFRRAMSRGGEGYLRSRSTWS